MGRPPSSDYEFRTFCRTGRGWVFAKVNSRLHKADCALLPYAYSGDKLLWEWEGEAQLRAYLNCYRQGWQPCPHCCGQLTRGQQGAQQQGTRQEAPPKTPPTSGEPTELQRAYAVFHLQESASLEIAEAAYKAVMKSVHPDKGGTDERAREATRAIEIIRQHCRQRQASF